MGEGSFATKKLLLLSRQQKMNQSIYVGAFSNQIFSYTCCITPKRVTNLLRPSPRYCARATRLLSKKCRSSVASRWQHCGRFRGLNLRPSSTETNALSLGQLAGFKNYTIVKYEVVILNSNFNCL